MRHFLRCAQEVSHGGRRYENVRVIDNSDFWLRSGSNSFVCLTGVGGSYENVRSIDNSDFWLGSGFKQSSIVCLRPPCDTFCGVRRKCLTAVGGVFCGGVGQLETEPWPFHSGLCEQMPRLTTIKTAVCNGRLLQLINYDLISCFLRMVQLSEILDGAAEWREILEGAAPDLQSLHCLLSSSFTAVTRPPGRCIFLILRKR